jgi:SAM-dependent methyltransferase
VGGERELPYPPFELATRVLALPSDDPEGFAAYEALGAETRAELLGLLPEGTDLRGKRLLDFGSGAGRTLRHFTTEAEAGEVWGVDIDERSVDWMRMHLSPPLNAAACAVDPPLDFDSDYFDFAWAISVFTHLSGNSAEWLLELHRVLKPGALLMASYMGKWNSEAIAGEPWDEDRVGMNELFHNRPWDQGGPMILMSDWWVEEHWGRAFDILDRKDVHGQTWTMLRKKEVQLTAEELLRPGDDPREWTALRHNIVQLQREIDAAWDRAASTERIAAPLRGARAKVEGLRARLGSKRD